MEVFQKIVIVLQVMSMRYELIPVHIYVCRFSSITLSEKGNYLSGSKYSFHQCIRGNLT